MSASASGLVARTGSAKVGMGGGKRRKGESEEESEGESQGRYRDTRELGSADWGRIAGRSCRRRRNRVEEAQQLLQADK